MFLGGVGVQPVACYNYSFRNHLSNNPGRNFKEGGVTSECDHRPSPQGTAALSVFSHHSLFSPHLSESVRQATPKYDFGSRTKGVECLFAELCPKSHGQAMKRRTKTPLHHTAMHIKHCLRALRGLRAATAPRAPRA